MWTWTHRRRVIWTLNTIYGRRFHYSLALHLSLSRSVGLSVCRSVCLFLSLSTSLHLLSLSLSPLVDLCNRTFNAMIRARTVLLRNFSGLQNKRHGSFIEHNYLKGKVGMRSEMVLFALIPLSSPRDNSRGYDRGPVWQRSFLQSSLFPWSMDIGLDTPRRRRKSQSQTICIDLDGRKDLSKLTEMNASNPLT